MAKKKKRAAPEKKCAKCGKGFHPRVKACPHCGAANASWVKRITPKKKHAMHASSHGAGEVLEKAAEFIHSAGGIENAEKLLEQLKRIRG